MASPEKLEAALRMIASEYVCLLEAVLYVAVAFLLSTAAAFAMYEAGAILCQDAMHGTSEGGLLALNQLLLVLMLVEILHTVRISIYSKELMFLEPFLIVGLIASIRRILVITLQSALPAPGRGTAEAAVSFRNGMIELALLGFLVLALAVSIYLLRRDELHQSSEPR